MGYNEIVRWDSLHVGNDRLCVPSAAQRFSLPRPALLQARGVSTFGHRSSQGHKLCLSPLGICVPSAWHREDAQLMYRDQCCTWRSWISWPRCLEYHKNTLDGVATANSKTEVGAPVVRHLELFPQRGTSGDHSLSWFRHYRIDKIKLWYILSANQYWVVQTQRAAFTETPVFYKFLCFTFTYFQETEENPFNSPTNSVICLSVELQDSCDHSKSISNISHSYN